MKFLLLLLFFSSLTHAWDEELKKEIENIDQGFPGEIGVVVKNLRDGTILEYNANKKWYLSSTIKVLVAISLMEEVDQKNISLDEKIRLQEKDFVDGAGSLIWSKPGEVFTIREILKAMLLESDNTATDILINLIGVAELNRDVTKWMPEAGKITSLLDVRILAYSELHPRARSLNNMDFILFKNIPLEKRHVAFAEKIQVPLKALNARDLEEAFEKYYKHGHNSASLQNFVALMENLENGKLLSKESTGLILEHLQNMKTGENRIKAGLSPELVFIQKTGTQIHRACNVGLIGKANKRPNLALAICIEKPSEEIDSDKVFKELGEKLSHLSILNTGRNLINRHVILHR